MRNSIWARHFSRIRATYLQTKQNKLIRSDMSPLYFDFFPDVAVPAHECIVYSNSILHPNQQYDISHQYFFQSFGLFYWNNFDWKSAIQNRGYNQCFESNDTLFQFEKQDSLLLSLIFPLLTPWGA